MSKIVTVTICGRSYNLVPSDESGQIEALAEQVDQAMSKTLQNSRATPLDAAVLTAVNAMDELRKGRESVDAMRKQLQECLEDNKRLRQELADTRREMTRMKNSAKKSAK